MDFKEARKQLVESIYEIGGEQAIRKWRAVNPNTEPCLRGAYLPGANLRDADLSGLDLTDANLSETDLLNANLRGSILYGANLKGAMLLETNFTNAKLDQPAYHWARTKQLEMARGLPPGLFADAVAAGYKG